MNCRLKQLLSMKLELGELQTNPGCEGSPKITFADVRTEKKETASSAPPAETPQPSAAARSVTEFLSEYDRTTGAAENIRINMITLRGNPEEAADLQAILEMQEAKKESEEENEAISLKAHRPFNAREEVAAFFEDLEKEELESAMATARLTIATAKVRGRRPEITEFTVPSKWDEENGCPRAFIICLQPDLPMSYLRTHVQFNHRVSIGDPISKWIHAAKVWDEKHPESGSSNEDKADCEVAASKPSVPAPRAKNNNTLNPEKKNRQILSQK